MWQPFLDGMSSMLSFAWYDQGKGIATKANWIQLLSYQSLKGVGM